MEGDGLGDLLEFLSIVTSENHSHETIYNLNEEGCSHCESEECKTSATLEDNSFSPRIETLSSVTSDDKLTWENHSHEASYNLNEEDNSHIDSEGCDTSTKLEKKSQSVRCCQSFCDTALALCHSFK